MSSEQELKKWRRAQVSLNDNALSHNLAKVREYAPASQVMAVIKANAYGHGLIQVAGQLATVDSFAVAMPVEAYALREKGITKPIIVLHGFCDAAELMAFSAQNISPVIHQSSQITLLQETPLETPVDVWLKVDTGMNRLGFLTQEFDSCFGELRNCANVANVYVMSHFSDADTADHGISQNQLNNFLEISNDVDADCSMANSAAIIRLPASHFEIVRPGIMLYGVSPFSDTSAAELGLQAVMQFESFLLDIKTVRAGESIGYGSSYKCKTDTRTGIVAAGYGDGYPRHAGNKAQVWINNKNCDLLGRVSMDSLCVDLSDTDAAIGDRVVLWGKEMSVDDVAHKSGTIAYELLCHAGSIFGMS